MGGWQLQSVSYAATFHRPVAVIAVGAAIAICVADIDPAHAIEPLQNAHAHNDYWHERPLLDALQRGFTSVEADIFLVGDQLLVGHETKELSSGKTLESLYLDPLERRVRENEGRVYPGGGRFFLFVDIKSDAAQTYERLQAVLEDYAQMLTVVEGDKVREGAVTIVVSGNRPKITVPSKGRRYAGLDGRLSDLTDTSPSHLLPVVSDHWPSYFTWTGAGPMPAQEQSKLRELVEKAHAADRVVRFWATPENEAVWRELHSAGVDLIGTDQLDRLAEFLRSLD
jgi:hypothetical protein